LDWLSTFLYNELTQKSDIFAGQIRSILDRKFTIFLLFFTGVTKQNKASSPSFPERLKSACEGLNFVSETDSGVEPIFGPAPESTSLEDLLTALGYPEAGHIEERDFELFFSRLIKQEAWFTPSQRSNARRFSALKRLLEAELNDLTVVRIGKIRLTIFVLGLDRKGVAGVKMNAVET
jgi:hypothetical protein